MNDFKLTYNGEFIKIKKNMQDNFFTNSNWNTN